jgi:hypothetical protein
LLNIAAVNDIFMITSQYSPNLTGTRNYDMRDMAGADIEFNIADIAKTSAVPAVDYFFFT